MKRTIFLFLGAILIAACSRAAEGTVTVPKAGTVQALASEMAPQQDYLLAANSALEDYRTAVDGLDAQIDMFEVNPQWLEDASWKETTIGFLDDMQTAAQAIQALPEAPSALSDLEEPLQALAGETTLYVESLTQGIENSDKNGIDQARLHREAIGKYRDEALAALTSYQGTVTP